MLCFLNLMFNKPPMVLVVISPARLCLVHLFSNLYLFFSTIQEH